MPLSQTGSTLTHTNLLSFARCTLGLNRHSPAIFIKIYYAITTSKTQGFTSRKYWLIENGKLSKIGLFAILNINSVTTGARELNRTSQILLAIPIIQCPKCERSRWGIVRSREYRQNTGSHMPCTVSNRHVKHVCIFPLQGILAPPTCLHHIIKVVNKILILKYSRFYVKEPHQPDHVPTPLCACLSFKIVSLNILTNFNYMTLTSLYIFQKTVDCKLPLLRWCHHELVSSANTSVLIAQLNLMT